MKSWPSSIFPAQSPPLQLLILHTGHTATGRPGKHIQNPAPFHSSPCTVHVDDVAGDTGGTAATRLRGRPLAEALGRGGATVDVSRCGATCSCGANFRLDIVGPVRQIKSRNSHSIKVDNVTRNETIGKCFGYSDI